MLLNLADVPFLALPYSTFGPDLIVAVTLAMPLQNFLASSSFGSGLLTVINLTVIATDF